jgi:hypothetical protein
MLNDFAREWVAALRSGEFKQGIGQLAHKRDNEPRYCCLGVACELAARKGIVSKQEERAQDIVYDNMLGGLPEPVREMLNLSTNNGQMYRDAISESLAFLNDEKRLSFQEIAAIIESEPKGLFKK